MLYEQSDPTQLRCPLRLAETGVSKRSCKGFSETLPECNIAAVRLTVISLLLSTLYKSQSEQIIQLTYLMSRLHHIFFLITINVPVVFDLVTRVPDLVYRTKY